MATCAASYFCTAATVKMRTCTVCCASGPVVPPPGLTRLAPVQDPGQNGKTKSNSAVAAVATKSPAQRSAFNVRMSGLVHVPVVVILGFMARDASHTHLRQAPWVGQLAGPDSFSSRRSLGTRWPPQAFDAARWGRNLAPMCDLTLTDIRCATLAGSQLALVPILHRHKRRVQRSVDG